MRAGLAYAAIGSLLLAGCETPVGTTGEAEDAEAAALPDAAAPHEDARFLVRGAGDLYRVNVRYVDMIEESVIAVRQGPGDADDAWPTIDLAEAPRAPTGLPFDAEAWRPVTLAIADTVRRQRDLCPEGREMRLSRENDGDVRTTYREKHGAWVFFAACAAPQAG